MLKEIFNPSNYFFNPHAIPNITVAILCFFLGSFVLRKKRGEGISLFLITFSVGIWFLAFALMYLTISADAAYLWNKVAYFLGGICFISINTYFFSLVATRQINDKKARLVLYAGYLLMIAFAVFDIFTSSIVKYPPLKLYWGYYPHLGFTHNIFLIFWFGFALMATYNFYRAYKREKNPVEKNRYKIFLYSYLLGYIAAFDYSPSYGVKYYPLGHIFISVYLSLTVYNFIKYKALGVETVIHKTLLWLASILLLILPAGMVTFLISKVLIGIFPPVLTVLAFSIILVVFAYYYFYLRPKIDYLFGKKQYAYYELLGRISETVSTTLDIGEFSYKLLNELDECILPHKILLWLVDEKKQYLYLFAQKTPPEEPRVFREAKEVVTGDDLIIKHLKDTGEVMEPGIISIVPQYRHLKDSAFLTVLKKETIEVIVPLVREGKLIGILGLGRKRSLRIYAKQDIGILKTLGEELGTGIYNALHHQDVLEKQRLQQEIFLAKNIQDNLLPKKAPLVPGLLLYGLYSPAKEIGGDYYDFITIKDRDQVYITIGDISGKGLDAGLVVSSVKSSLTYLTRYHRSTKDILNILNNDLYTNLSQQKFISLLLFQYTALQNKLIYSSGGHEHILLCREGRIETIKSGGVILGMLDNIGMHLEEKELQLNKGDKVLLYTDGATEARNPEEELYGLRRLEESFRRHAHLSIKEVVQNTYQEIKEFISTRDQYDDITLVGIEKE